MKTTNFQLGLPQVTPLPTVISTYDTLIAPIVTKIRMPITVYIPKMTTKGSLEANYLFWMRIFRRFFFKSFANVNVINSTENSSSTDHLFAGAIETEAVFTSLNEINPKLQHLFFLLREQQFRGNYPCVVVSIDRTLMEFDFEC